MENKSGKVIAIAALVVAVVALSVGFAAFADTLTIDGTATASASDSVFDTANAGLNYQSDSAKCYLTNDNTKTAIEGANVGTFTNDNDSWTGISVPLGSTAKDVTCEAIIENKSSYIAHITSLSTSGGLTCASTGANDNVNRTNVCGATTVTVSINDGTHSADTIEIKNAAASAASHNTVIPATSGTATVTVRINYAGATADADTTITIPTITHNYSSANGN